MDGRNNSMCIAIYQPVGEVLDDALLGRCYQNNPDGCGMAYIHAESGKVQIYKTLKFKKWLKRYKSMVKENPESPFLLHFRIKTHGIVNVDNCHPFKIDAGHAFIHNGMISKCAPTERNGEKSDTRLFNEMILQNLPKNWFDNQAIKDLIEPWIGNSKLCILKADGRVNIINEEKGNWKEGVWFSNTSYEETFTRKKVEPWVQPHLRATPPNPLTVVKQGYGGTKKTITGGINIDIQNPKEATKQLCRFYHSHPETEFVVQNKHTHKWHPAFWDKDRKANVAYHFGYDAWIEWDYLDYDFDVQDMARAQNVFIAKRNAGKTGNKDGVFTHVAVERNQKKLSHIKDCGDGALQLTQVMCDGCGCMQYYRNLNEFTILNNYTVELCVGCEQRYLASEITIKKLTHHTPV
jgi:hypothetical protein